VSLRENADIVCLSHGQDRESDLLSERFARVLETQTTLANWSLPLNTATQIFAYFGAGLVYVCVLQYVRRHPELSPGDLMMFTSKANFYVIMLIQGFTLVFNLMEQVARLSGYATRILELIRVLLEHRKAVSLATVGDRVEMRNATIAIPNDQVLLRGISFRVLPGESLFITGPSGIGKSSIFRVLGQLWPVTEGEVVVPREFMILTNQSYLPWCSPIECCCFPKAVDTVDLAVVDEAVRFLGLEEVMARSEDNWLDGLSEGERQRICLVRVFVHRPRFLLLDEAVTAIPRTMMTAVYERLMAMNISIISISQDDEIKAMHTFSLEFEDNRLYQLTTN
jgi:ABC-type uncharacterized transport system fused permease/ATPase subunit